MHMLLQYIIMCVKLHKLRESWCCQCDYC